MYYERVSSTFGMFPRGSARKSHIQIPCLDRSVPFYATADAQNLARPKLSEYKPTNNMEKLRDVLMTYACCASDGLGYVQGMSDLASPLLYVMNGDEAATFGCFSAIMKTMGSNFRKDGTGMKAQLDAMETLIQVADKPLHEHLGCIGFSTPIFT